MNTLTDINKILLGQSDSYNSLPAPMTPIDDISNVLTHIRDNSRGLWNPDGRFMTRSYKEFYEANPMLDAFVEDCAIEFGLNSVHLHKTFFFSVISECYIPDVPSELVAMFVLTKKTVETPNKMVAALDKMRLDPFISKRFSEDTLIFKKLLNTLWGYEVQLVTEDRPMVENKGIVEIYISNINDILLCNPSIKDILTSVDDVKSLEYSKEKGITVGKDGVPLRTLIQCYGVTKDDLDLRKVFLSDGV